jgi:hypothetical protein
MVKYKNMKSMNTRIGVGLLTASLVGCSAGNSPDIENPGYYLTVEAEGGAVVYDQPYNQESALGEPITELKLGQSVLAYCVALNEAEELAMVRVQDGDTSGFANVYSLQGSKDTDPSSVFDASLEEIRNNIPECSVL